MKIKFITAIYSDLHGTELGGRPSRGGHYRYSLLSLLKMTNADFLCYTSDREIEDLKRFFYEENEISEDKLKFDIDNLTDSKFKTLIEQYKDVEGVKKGDRCHEIQFNKFHWWEKEDKSYDYYYWIDAGLSHCGLLPDKYLTPKPGMQKFYESELFNNNFLKNLVDFTGDKFFIIGKDNVRNYWSGTVNPIWYVNYDNSIHVIGGLFGGKPNVWNEIVGLFDDYLQKIIEGDKRLYHEENILSLMYVNHRDLFVTKNFDIWWNVDSRVAGVSEDFFIINKSFYTILEELNSP